MNDKTQNEIHDSKKFNKSTFPVWVISRLFYDILLGRRYLLRGHALPISRNFRQFATILVRYFGAIWKN